MARGAAQPRGRGVEADRSGGHRGPSRPHDLCFFCPPAPSLCALRLGLSFLGLL